LSCCDVAAPAVRLDGLMLYLVRHAAVEARPDVPGPRWYLSSEGRAGAEALAKESYWAEVQGIHTSCEPKAVGTTQRIAAPNELPIRVEHDLREVEGRSWVDIGYADQVHAYLSGDTPPGWEPLDAAQSRLTACIDGIVERHQDLNVGIVSHGIVLTLYLSGKMALSTNDAIALWESISFPDIAVFDPEKRSLVKEFGG
jgi:broad specificity phosphatase PhoE